MPVPPLTATAELARLRQKYPDGLWCTNPEPCDHRLLATTAAGWAKSWPPDERLARRDTFICADCTQRAGERERVAAVRRQNLAKNLEGMRAQVLVEEPQTAPEIPVASDTVLRRVAVGRAFQPGRPKVSAEDHRRKARERDRAYRLRRRHDAAATL